MIARKKLQMLLDDFERNKKSEEVHFICNDSKSALLKEVATVPNNIKTHGNEEGEKLSKIVNNILKDTSCENVNLIIDEFDGESLDKEEAETLNGIFEEKFQNAVVFLLPQSMEKERNSNAYEKLVMDKERNRFDLLHNFDRVELKLVMRNSIEINNLIRVTQNFLKEQETIFRHPREENTSKLQRSGMNM